MGKPGNNSGSYQDALQTIIDFLPTGITMFNAEQQMVVCNQNFRTLLEFPDSMFENGMPLLHDLAIFNAKRGEYGPGDPQALAEQVCARARTMQPHVFERQRPNGTFLEIRGEPLPGGGWVAIYTDITEITLARQALEQMALHDPLTGLANRRKFQDRFHLERLRQVRSGEPLTLLLLDIDHFKQVNDKLGHIVGDTCLKVIAGALVGNLRSIDLVARFGGEEFLVLLTDTGAETGLLVAEKLRRALENEVIDTGLAAQPELKITASFGVCAVLPSQTLSLEAAIECADRALYAAKCSGRNRVCLAADPVADEKPESRGS